jgi:hypothetical protein
MEHHMTFFSMAIAALRQSISCLCNHHKFHKVSQMRRTVLETGIWEMSFVPQEIEGFDQ